MTIAAGTSTAASTTVTASVGGADSGIGPAAHLNVFGASEPSRSARRETISSAKNAELVGPGCRRRGDVERPVARHPQWPSVARDRLAHGVRPGGGQGGKRNRIPAAPACELALHLASDPLHSADLARGRTASDCAGSTGSAEVAVAVITVCEHRSIIRARARRRSPSSSESTSSSRTSGDRPRRSRSADASARTSARTAIRCSPWEPNTRRSRPAASIRTSCRCGSGSGDTALEIDVHPCAEVGQRRRLAIVGKGRGVEAELARSLRERGREPLECDASSLHELLARARRRLPSTGSGHPETRSPARARRSPAFR